MDTLSPPEWEVLFPGYEGPLSSMPNGQGVSLWDDPFTLKIHSCVNINAEINAEMGTVLKSVPIMPT